jgi:hypothetical protein
MNNQATVPAAKNDDYVDKGTAPFPTTLLLCTLLICLLTTIATNFLNKQTGNRAPKGMIEKVTDYCRKFYEKKSGSVDDRRATPAPG